MRLWLRGLRALPDLEGVYAIVRESMARPIFTEEDHSKPRATIRTAVEAAERWVPDVQLLYFGKGPLRNSTSHKRDGLAQRIYEFQQHGYAGGANHYGGKLIWQISSADQLLVAWKTLPDRTSDSVESGLILGFNETLGMQPYANVGSPRRGSVAIFINLLVCTSRSPQPATTRSQSPGVALVAMMRRTVLI